MCPAYSVGGDDPKGRVARDHIEVAISVQDLDLVTDRDRGCEAIELATDGLTACATGSVDLSGGFPCRQVSDRNQMHGRKHALQTELVIAIPSTSQHLEHDGLARQKLIREKGLGESSSYLAPRTSQELHPCR